VGGQPSRRNGQPGRNDQALADGDDDGCPEQRYTQGRLQFHLDGQGSATAALDDTDAGRRWWQDDEVRPGQSRPGRTGSGEPLGSPSGSRLSVSASVRQGRNAADASYWPPDRSYQGEWPSELEPAVRRVADGMAPWVDRLRLTGNGVVPLAAAVAFLRLRDRLIDEQS